MYKIILIGGAVFLTSFLCDGQTIEGIVVDSVTHEGIPYVNIYSAKSQSGAITNSEGKFALQVKTEDIELQISHISYKNKTILLNKNDVEPIIVLSTSRIFLNEITVSDEAYKIARKVLDRFLLGTPITYGKALYRQVTINTVEGV